MKKLKLFLLLMLIITQQALTQSFSGGTGTVSDPYLVSSYAQLITCKDYPTKSYKLANNIDCAGNTATPIGTPSVPFTGNFDGAGFIISDLEFSLVSSTTTKYWGFIGVASGSTIKNLTFDGCSVSIHTAGNDYYVYGEYYNLIQEYDIGILAGRLTNCTVTDVMVRNGTIWTMTEKCNYQSTQGTFYLYEGGLIGYASGCSITHGVTTSTNISNTNSFSDCGYQAVGNVNVGGLIGNSVSSTLLQCCTGVTFGLGNGNPATIYVAGMIGTGSGNISNSFSIVKTNVAMWNPGLSSPNRYNVVYYNGFIGSGAMNAVNCYSVLYRYAIGVDSHTRHGYFNSINHSGSTSSCVGSSQALTANDMNNYVYKGNYGGTITNSDTLTMKNVGFWQGKSYDMINIWSIDPMKNLGYPYLTAIGGAPAPFTPGTPVLEIPSNGRVNYCDSYANSLLKYSAERATSFKYEVFDMNDVLILSGYDSPYPGTNPATATTYALFENLDYGTQYKWKVTAINAYGTAESGYSYFTTAAFTGTLAAPVLQYPTADTTGIAMPYNFRWNSSNGATKYDLEIFNSNTNVLVYSSSDIATTNKSVTFTLVNGTRYRWRVMAKNNTDSSAWSTRYFTSALTVPGTPTQITPTNNNVHVIINDTKFKWNKVPGVVSYYHIDVYDSTAAKTITMPYDIASPDTQMIILKTSGFAKNSWYRWRVRAHNTAGDGTYSTWWKFKADSIKNDNGGQNPLPPLGLSPSCLGGYGGITTIPKRDTLHWSWASVDGEKSFMKGIGFIKNPDTTKIDTAYVAVSGQQTSSRYMFKMPADSSEFHIKPSDGQWLIDNTNWYSTNASLWNYMEIYGGTNLSSVVNGDNPGGNGITQVNDSTFIMLGWRYYSYTKQPVIIIKTSHTHNTYIPPYSVIPQYQSNYMMQEKPYVLADSLIMFGLQQEIITSSPHVWTYNYILLFNMNTHTWKANRWKYYYQTGTAARNIDVISGFAQLDTTLYFYTNSEKLYNGDHEDYVKIWKLNPSGITKILTNSYTDTLATADYSLVYNFRTQGAAADTATSAIVDNWIDRSDCWWYLHTYNRTQGTSKLWKFTGDSLKAVTLPNNTLKLSSAYVNPEGTYIYTVFQDWTLARGGLNSIAYKIHALTGVVDTLNIPVGNVTGSSADSIGFFNYCTVWKDSIMYMMHRKSSTGYWSNYIMANSPDCNRVWFTIIPKESRTPYPVRSDEYLQIRGIKPKATRKAASTYR